METIATNKKEQQIWDLLDTVNDPEIPVLSVCDLGIVRGVHFDGETYHITITPTYSGCPAMDVIALNIRMALLTEGLLNLKIIQQLSPAWTTDWMTEKGKAKLRSYGIAPPVSKSLDATYLDQMQVPCPLCQSVNTRLISEFGSTPCKALYQCNDCKEPFDHFKCH